MLPNADPTGSQTIVRKNQATLNLNFTLLRASRSLTATLTDGTNPITLTAVLPPLSSTSYAGNYTLAMRLATGDLSNDANPKGHSVGAFKVSTKGAVTGVIKLADASAPVTLSGIVGEGGNLPIFTLLYARTGSLLGSLNIGAGGALNASSLSWFKHTQTVSTRSYKGTFGPLTLETIGRPYVIPSMNGITMGLTGGAGNARLIFRDGSAPSPANRLDWSALKCRKAARRRSCPLRVIQAW
jgi:hypothetical protein